MLLFSACFLLVAQLRVLAPGASNVKDGRLVIQDEEETSVDYVMSDFH